MTSVSITNADPTNDSSSEQVLAVTKKLEELSSSFYGNSSIEVVATGTKKDHNNNDAVTHPTLSTSHSDDTSITTTSNSSSTNDNHHKLETTPSRDHYIPTMKIVFTGTPGTIEPTTGIAYPHGLNDYTFVGCGVRTKYLVIHAYAVGLYWKVKPSVLQRIHTSADMQKLLLDPQYPKVFRLVMNRNVTSSQYIGATFDALTPLMRGKDMDKLYEMKRQEMPTNLPYLTEIYLMVQGDKLTIQVGAAERAGEIRSLVLTSAICENYLGDKPVSPAMKKAVWNELEKLRCVNNRNCKR